MLCVLSLSQKARYKHMDDRKIDLQVGLLLINHVDSQARVCWGKASVNEVRQAFIKDHNAQGFSPASPFFQWLTEIETKKMVGGANVSINKLKHLMARVAQ